MKGKIIAAVTAISVLAQPVITGTPEASVKSVIAQAASSVVAGDVNADGIVSIADLVMLQNHILRGNGISADSWQNADLDGDSVIDSFDVALLRQIILRNNGLQEFSGLLINEVCSSAKESVKDAAGESPDWIEIYNSSDKAMDISGIGLSDGAKKKFKFAFPEGTIIPADGYILVYCDDAVNEAEGEYHAAFKLSADGESVYMTHPDYGEIDFVKVPLLDEDVTWGRFANGSDNFTYLSYTPGKTNDTAEDLTPVEMPRFSAEGGFYDDAFGLTLSDAFGSEIIYTTDGSDPRTSETAKPYASEIKIYNNTSDPNVYSAITDINLSGYKAPKNSVDKGIIVRAVCRTAEGKFSDVATNSYFVGKNADYYTDFKVVSLSTDSDYLFDKDNGFYMVGKNYRDLVSSGKFILRDANDASNPTNYNIDGKESEFPANVQVFEEGKLVYTNDVGARLSGNWSRGFAQKSIRLYARSEYGDSKLKYEFIEELTDINGDPIKEFDKVTLRNGGTDNQLLHFRDLLIQSLCTDRALAVQAGEPCIVFIDGEFWGFYFIREKQDADFVEAHYGIDKDNVTFIKNGELDDGSKELDSEYKEFLKWAGSADMTNSANYQKVCDALDIQSLIDMVVIETYINNVDWATEYMNNWITWRATEPDEKLEYADGKWRYMLYDLDFSADYFDDARSLVGFDSLNNLYMGGDPYNFVPMFYNLLNNKDFADQFYNSYIDIMKNNFEPVRVSAKLDEFVEKYKEIIMITNTRFDQEWVNLNYDAEIEAFRQFFIGRRNLAKMYLDRLYGKETNLTVGSDILSDESGWSYYGDAKVSKSDGTFTLTANKACLNSWDIQSQSKSFTIEKGKTYKVTFEASCTTNSPIAVTINHQVGNSWPSCFSKSGINLTNDFKEYSFTFVSAHNTASDWKLCFDFGNGAGVYTIRNASITPISFDTELVNGVGYWELFDPAGYGEFTVNAPDSITVKKNTDGGEVQPFYSGIVLDAGKNYTLSFTAKSDTNRDISVNVWTDKDEIITENASVGTSAKKFTYTFTADEQCMDASIFFICGGDAGTIEISDISLICKN
ncbi:MAG: CotH kinase family protein [Ruminococcus sp.]|nr:CotH kinase family protein [Ruminococcus sp.]